MNEVSLGLWGLFVSAFISSTVAPGGSEAVLLYLLNTGQYKVLPTLAVATIGNSLGALTTWLLGWLLARKFPVDESLDKDKQKSIRLVRKWGVWSLLFSWLPVIGDGLCFAGGWLKLAFWPAFLLIVIGKGARYAFLAYWVT